MKVSEASEKEALQKRMNELFLGGASPGREASQAETSKQESRSKAEEEKPAPAEKPSAPAEVDTTPYQGRVELRVVRPATPALIRRLEKEVSSISGIKYEGMWSSTREGSVLVINLADSLPLLKTLGDMPMVVKAEPDKTARTKRIAVSLGEKESRPVMQEPTERPAPSTKPAAPSGLFRGRVKLVTLGVVSVADLVKFQTILNKNGIGKVGDISPLEDGSGSVFTVELAGEVPLKENLERALAGVKIEEESLEKLRLSLPSNW